MQSLSTDSVWVSEPGQPVHWKEPVQNNDSFMNKQH